MACFFDKKPLKNVFFFHFYTNFTFFSRLNLLFLKLLLCIYPKNIKKMVIVTKNLINLWLCIINRQIGCSLISNTPRTARYVI